MAGQTQTLLQSIAASGLESSTAADGTYKYETALYIGRGIPDAWLTPGHRPQAAAARHDRPGPDRDRLGVLHLAVDHGHGHQQRHLPGPIQRRRQPDPYWGDWPQTGSHWVELDWTSPIGAAFGRRKTRVLIR
ncbi:hypothetical protein [Actinocrinis sp.]|uniref:hypothetical protein n=1 Tax=Actinocrinis sp. TaxID=1920516 RepID=UPI002D51EA86|nr:hypothetical protein [Actinocrinis sp.]HZP52945.1 hypothetical protein [Actinocrinis sp.]